MSDRTATTQPTSAHLELLAAARAAQDHAYAPYSGFRVGAAVRSESGKVYAGCNVENASYGVALCAERNAIGHMIAAGDERLSAVAIFADGDEPAMPCGICLQALAEFGDAVEVTVACRGASRTTTLAKLLPEPFRLKPRDA
jgi:cytidine deaminase